MCEVMDRDLRNLRRQALALGQGIWHEWRNAGAIAAATTSVRASISGGPVS
jgi:hypothetical protein